jgi:pimeloyl-ACP methyl ester carboxylesterase
MTAGLAALGLLATTSAVAPALAADGPASTLRGTLDNGGNYVLHTPTDWNGTLLVWNPGYGRTGEAPAGPSEGVTAWLLDQGFALAGTTASAGGWNVEHLIDNQPYLLEVVEDELGQPGDVIAWGSSMGGLTTAALMERYPEDFDAGLPLCGSVAGTVPMLNGSLDGSFALRTLLAPGDDRLELVDIRDEGARQAAFREVLDEAQATPEGRARIALAASVAQVPTWTQPGTDEPDRKDLDALQEQLYAAFMFGVISPRQPLEERAGGNFSWNTGVDYSQSLVHSGNASLVRARYRDAGLSLAEDLGTLAGAERISADQQAVDYMQRNATPTGDLQGPVLTLHETGDTAPTVAQAATYADRVRGQGDRPLLRQAFVDRPGHCDYADAEVAALVVTLQERLDTGRWADLAQPGTLNALADDLAEAGGLERGGVFATYQPDHMLRPEREDAR